MNNTTETRQVRVSTYGKGWRALIDALENCTPFKTSGALQAIAGVPYSTGRLPSEEAQRFEADRPRITYTVIYYATPIAWVTEDGATYIPPVKYSVRTTRNQNLVKAWLNRSWN